MSKILFKDRLLDAVSPDEINQKDLARRAGVGYDTVREIFRGRSKSVSVDAAYAITKCLGLSLDEIFSGNVEITNSSNEHQFSSIPRYDVALSAGHGAFLESNAEVLDYIPVTQDFLRTKLGRENIDGLICVDVRGESMEPTLIDGDLIMVDTKVKGIAAGVYAVNFNEESFVKRVEKIGNGYSLLSDNRAYPPIRVDDEDINHLNIIGKVVWAAKTDFRKP